MKPFIFNEILSIIGGKILHGKGDIWIKRVVRKPERIKRNTLYFHLSKKQFACDLFKDKQSCVIVTDQSPALEQLPPSITIVKVDECLSSFKMFISYYRNLFSIPVIGITGTCGKTTTKEMIKHILGQEMTVQSTFKSQNAISLNLHYLMGINEKTEAAVIEMGVSHPGNLKKTGEYFKPNVGVITNIGVAHLEGCKTFDNYLHAKAEMLEVLGEGGTLILNGDDENIKKLDLQSFNGEIIYFGLNERHNFYAEEIHYADEVTTFTLNVNQYKKQLTLRITGEHNIYNALAAMAASSAIGLELDVIVKNIQTFENLERHIQVYHGVNQCYVIDDTWNCNATSMRAALHVLKETNKSKSKIAVLGKLQRLGESETVEHIKMGETLMNIGGVDTLVTVGEQAELIGKRAYELGMSRDKIYTVQTADQLEEVLRQLLDPKSVVLFKMSLDKMDASFKQLIKKIGKQEWQ